jgi:glycerol kinase
MKYILVIDEGTSHTRAILFDLHGQIQNIAERELTQYYPHPGWVEHCPDEIWKKTQLVIKEVCAQIDAKDIISCGITNQRETMLLWNQSTGQCISRAIVWQDRRTQTICDELKSYEPMVQEKTGLKMDPYFSASKLKWLIKHYQIDDFKDLVFGTIDTYLLWKLTGEKVHATDLTNASRTLLFNIHDQSWDDELLQLFNIPRSILPQVLDSDAEFGLTAHSILGRGIPIRALIGDQQASLVGVGAMKWGQAKMTYGTGAFMLANTGAQICQSHHGLLTTIAYRIRGQVAYALEGSIYDAGSSLHWLKNSLGLIKDYQETQILAESVNSHGGVYFVPAFSGLGAPHWLPSKGASFVGMSRSTEKAHLVRAVLESIAYQTRDILAAMNHDMGKKISHLSVDGGVAKNQWLIQFLANLNQITIHIPHTFENTAKGAAWIAAQALDAVDDIQAWQIKQNINPEHLTELLEQSYQGWLNIIKKQKKEANDTLSTNF